jgi:hypothetical protein
MLARMYLDSSKNAPGCIYENVFRNIIFANGIVEPNAGSHIGWIFTNIVEIIPSYCVTPKKRVIDGFNSSLVVRLRIAIRKFIELNQHIISFNPDSTAWYFIEPAVLNFYSNSLHQNSGSISSVDTRKVSDDAIFNHTL